MRTLCALLWLALASCGPSHIILRVSSDVAIPEEANLLSVTTSNVDLSRELFVDVYDLPSGRAFPLDVLLIPGDETPMRLHQQVELLLDEELIAAQEVQHRWERHHDTVVNVELERLR